MIYTYYCYNCQKEFETEQKVNDNKLESCIICDSGPVKRLISKTSFILLGDCWGKDNYSK